MLLSGECHFAVTISVPFAKCCRAGGSVQSVLHIFSNHCARHPYVVGTVKVDEVNVKNRIMDH